MTEYVHGYGSREQERLVEQAEHWRHRLIASGTQLEPGTRLLEVGCGAGAVLAVLGQEFPGVRLTGVDIEAKQLEFARGHLERSGVEATLVQADARALPFGGDYLYISSIGSFAYAVWTDWRDVVAGSDPREAGDNDSDAADLHRCRAANPDGTFGADTCPFEGGLDQNIYGSTSP